MNIKRQKGYTLFELVYILFGIVILAGVVGAIWVIAHFVAKFW